MREHSPQRVALAAGVAMAAWVGACVAPAGAVALLPIAVAGETAPGLGVDFRTGFGTPVVNATGRVAFQADLQTTGANGATTASSVWSDVGGPLSLLAIEGTAAPGVPDVGAQWDRLGDELHIDRDGLVAFTGNLVNVPFGTTGGIWAQNDDGTHRLVVRGGQPVPNLPNHQWENQFANVGAGPRFVYGGGRVAFRGTTDRIDTGGNGPTGIWSEGQSNAPVGVDVLARTPRFDLPQPDTDFTGIGPPVINQLGRTAFNANFNTFDNGQPSGNAGGIWSEGLGAFSLVVQTGATGAADGEYDFLNDPVINDQGRVVFSGNFSNIATTSDDAIFRQNLQTASPEVLESSGAPGTTGVFAGSFAGTDYIMNRPGAFAFNTNPFDPVTQQFTGRALFSTASGSLALVAQTGMDAPDTEAGTTFMLREGGITQHVLNARGELAFIAGLQGPGVGPNNLALYVQRHGELQLIARRGDTVETAPGQSFIINTLEFAGLSGNEDGRTSGFSDTGEVAFRAAGFGSSGEAILLGTSDPGDTDFDGDVDLDDALTLRNNYTGAAGAGKTRRDGDFDRDGDVDFGDAVTLRRNYQGGAFAPSASSTQLALTVDVESGALALTGIAADLAGVSIRSSGGLVPTDAASGGGGAGGLSLEDSAAAATWLTLEATAVDGAQALAAAWDPQAGRDLAFYFATAESGGWVRGDVRYVPEPAAGVLLALATVARRRRA